MPQVFTKNNYEKVLKRMREEARRQGDNCTTIQTKRIISEVIDRVDLGVVNKFLKGMVELGYLNRKGNRYEVPKDIM